MDIPHIGITGIFVLHNHDHVDGDRNFHTTTHPKTNLARCFDCQKNFKPIDMVMAASQCGFVDSVELLIENVICKGGPI